MDATTRVTDLRLPMNSFDLPRYLLYDWPAALLSNGMRHLHLNLANGRNTQTMECGPTFSRIELLSCTEIFKP